jgi:hypothetical protein
LRRLGVSGAGLFREIEMHIDIVVRAAMDKLSQRLTSANGREPFQIHFRRARIDSQ